jgi:uncharacterized cupredoxin-like copper-binding protein
VPLALSTGHQVGLAVTGAAFIAFALFSSFLFPRFRPQYPGGGLPAFIVVCFVFFFGMLTAVEVFGADKKKASERVAETTSEPTTTQPTTTVTLSVSTGRPTTSPPKPVQATTVAVTETEFKISLDSTSIKAGKVIFFVKNVGKIPHDLAIKGGQKTKLIQPGADAQFAVTLKAGKYHLYCSVPGHEQAGMKLDITVTGAAPAGTTSTAARTTTAAKPQLTTVDVTEQEFKISLSSTTLKRGKITFDIKNTGKLPHDLAIRGGPKSKLIQPGTTGQLIATLNPGKYHLYCSAPGHEQAGMKLDITVS